MDTPPCLNWSLKSESEQNKNNPHFKKGSPNHFKSAPIKVPKISYFSSKLFMPIMLFRYKCFYDFHECSPLRNCPLLLYAFYHISHDSILYSFFPRGKKPQNQVEKVIYRWGHIVLVHMFCYRVTWLALWFTH